MKTEMTIFRTTKEQKDFLLEQSNKEQRTLTAIINIALCEKYPEYKAISERKEKI